MSYPFLLKKKSRKNVIALRHFIRDATSSLRKLAKFLIEKRLDNESSFPSANLSHGVLSVNFPFVRIRAKVKYVQRNQNPVVQCKIRVPSFRPPTNCNSGDNNNVYS